jgi:hypothetical protein
MKRLIVLAICAVLFSMSAFAGVPGKTEVTLSGALVDVNDGPNIWFATGDCLFPLGNGHVVLGPTITLGSKDVAENAGVALDWNLMGQKSGTFFIGASASYFSQSLEDAEDFAVTARAGFKFNVGKGALLKLYATQIVDGRGADVSDLAVAVGIGAKF